MDIKPYTPENFDSCVEIFQSNLDLYFADYELDEFKAFLKGTAYRSSYFVLLEKGEVIGCGGYEKYGDEIVLTWGMIQRNLHGQGYGQTLTQFRLNAIMAKYPNCTIRIDTSQHSQGFYLKQGFILQDIEKDGFAPGLDKFVMTYQIATPSTIGEIET
jgi:hypothetical protein